VFKRIGNYQSFDCALMLKTLSWASDGARQRKQQPSLRPKGALELSALNMLDRFQQRYSRQDKNAAFDW
jgi:hypothetical protein